MIKFGLNLIKITSQCKFSDIIPIKKAKFMKFNPFIMRHLDIYYMLVASFYLALNAAMAKILSSQISSVEIIFLRNLISLVLMLWIFKKAKFTIGHGGKPFLLIFRGVIGSLGLLATFYNVAHIDLGAAFTFQKTAPIWTALFSAFLLGEKLNSKAWFGILIGFVGVICIVQPHIEIHFTDIIGIFSGICAGLAYTSVRELRKYYSSNAIILSFMICAVISTSFIMLLGEFDIGGSELKFINPNTFGWILVVLIGITGMYFQIYMTKSYAATRKAGIVAAVSYSDIIFAMFFGIILGDSFPNLLTTLGIVIIILSGVIVARQK